MKKQTLNYTTIQHMEKPTINICIIGGVSVGKTTFFQALFAGEYDDVAKKRSTMHPHVYRESSNPAALPKHIKLVNSTKNASVIEKTERGIEITGDDIVELTYDVGHVYDFVGHHASLNRIFYDTPGLNDAKTKNIYYKYLSDNFCKFDVVVLMIDVNTGMNTSDEMEILQS